MYQQLRYLTIVLLLPIFSTRSMEPGHVKPKIKTIDERVLVQFKSSKPEKDVILHCVPPEIVNTYCLPYINCKGYFNYKRSDQHVKVSCPVITKFGENTIIGEYEQDTDARGNLYHNFLNPEENLTPARRERIKKAEADCILYENVIPDMLRPESSLKLDTGRYRVTETFPAFFISDKKLAAKYIILKNLNVKRTDKKTSFTNACGGKISLTKLN